MKWTWKVARVAGVPIYVHATFLILIAWIALTHWSYGQDIRTILRAILFSLALFACIVLHELGHALTAKRYGISTRDITLLPIGGVSSLERMPDDPREELPVALAGPAVSLAIASVLFLVLSITGGRSPLAQISSWTTAPFLEQLMLANFVLAVFNLLPAFPMDGGRIFRALLARRLGYYQATQIAASVGQGMAFLFGLLGLFTNPFLIFIALFVWIGAAQEAAAAQMRSVLAGIPVRQVTVTQFTSLSPTDTLQRAVELMLHGSQQDFPVLDDGRLVGILTRKDLLRGLSQEGQEAPVSQIMCTQFPVVPASEMLPTVLDKFADPNCRVLPVLDHGKMLGLFTLENLGEFVMVQSALKRLPEISKQEPIACERPSGNRPSQG
ncbi:MAG: site-2 protease family protein [Terriglobales bacterium]